MILCQFYKRLRTANLNSYFFSKLIDHPIGGQLPPYFDINLSLQSNIQKRKNIQQVLKLHKMMRSYYTPSHYAKSMRVITQIIDKQKTSKGRMHTKQPYNFKTHLQEWKGFFSDLWGIKDHRLSTDDKIDFLHFIYKTKQYRISIKTIQYSYGKELDNFRKQLIQSIVDPREIEEFKLPQLAVIFYYMMVILQEPSHLQLVLLQIEKQLNQQNSCILMHLVLIGKALRDLSQFDQYRCLDKAMLNNLKKLTASTIFSQIFNVSTYLNILVIVDVYNLIRQYPEYQPALLAKAIQLLPQLSDADYSLAFQTKELPIFITELSRKEQLGSETKQLLDLLRTKLSARKKPSYQFMKAHKSESMNDPIT